MKGAHLVFPLAQLVGLDAGIHNAHISYLMAATVAKMAIQQSTFDREDYTTGP